MAAANRQPGNRTFKQTLKRTLVPNLARLVLLAACVAMPLAAARADFTLAGKTVGFYVGGGIGGGVDSYARTLAPYLTKYLPGQPAIVIYNMGASGGVQGVQYLYNVAAKDGTAFGTTNAGPVSEPLMGTIRVSYDLTKFRWFGSLTRGDTVCGVWKTSSLNSIADARTREVPIAVTGATSGAARVARLLNNLVGTKFKPISGYAGNSMYLAVERGEAEGTCNTLSALRTTRSNWLRDKDFRLLLQISFDSDPEFPDVPRAADFVKSEADRQLLELYLLPYEFNNPLMLPPGAPDDALAAYRAAFDAAVRDPDYKADLVKRVQRIAPRNGAEVEQMLTRLLATPKDVVARMLDVTDPKLHAGK